MIKNETFENIIKNYFLKFKTVINSAVKKFCKDNPEISLYLDEYLNEYPEFGTKVSLIIAIIHNLELRKCKVCRKINEIFYDK